ncbi:unnamed protein product [Closterium sp. NIES-53]
MYQASQTHPNAPNPHHAHEEAALGGCRHPIRALPPPPVKRRLILLPLIPPLSPPLSAIPPFPPMRPITITTTIAPPSLPIPTLPLLPPALPPLPAPSPSLSPPAPLPPPPPVPAPLPPFPPPSALPCAPPCALEVEGGRGEEAQAHTAVGGPLGGVDGVGYEIRICLDEHVHGLVGEEGGSGGWRKSSEGKKGG